MVKVVDDGLFPCSREKVWQLIQAHQTDVYNIHPAIKSTKPLNKEGDTVEQEWEMGGQRVKLVAKFTPNPPDTLTIEFLQGPMTGKIVNRYTEVSGGTKVVTECDMKSSFLDDKQLEGMVKKFLDDGYSDDMRYLTTKMK